MFKHHHPTTRETPSEKLQTKQAAVLVIGVWIFSGAWCLEFLRWKPNTKNLKLAVDRVHALLKTIARAACTRPGLNSL
jgi:hypothetical protein